MRFDDIPTPAIHRLSFYLRQLEAFKQADRHTISSRLLGQSLGYTDAQVRKDLAYFGQFGHPGIGYKVSDLITQLRKILGTDKVWNTLLIGAGNLGRALVAYRGFLNKGFRLSAIFDTDPQKHGQTLSDLTILPLSQLSLVAQRDQIRIALLAVPASAAQDVCDQAVAAGIQGILNFAPTNLAVPPSVALQSVDLALQLEQLAFRMSLLDQSSDNSPTFPHSTPIT